MSAIAAPLRSVKQEKSDPEIEQKLRTLTAASHQGNEVDPKPETVPNGQSTKDETAAKDATHNCNVHAAQLTDGVEDKKSIQPVKSSNEILAELFQVFNAAPPVELLSDEQLMRKSQKLKKHKKEKKKKHKQKDKDKKEKHRHKTSEDAVEIKVKVGEASKQPEATAIKIKKESRIDKDLHGEKRSSRKRHPESDTERRHSKRSRHLESKTKVPAQSKANYQNGFNADGSARHDTSDISEISLSDEETYLKQRSNAAPIQSRETNSFYAGFDRSDETRERVARRGQRESWQHERSRSRSHGLGIDKKRLLEIARKNAIKMFKRGSLPGCDKMSQDIKDKVLLKMRYGGRTVNDLTDFCKKISNGENLLDLSSDEDSDVDKSGKAKAFHHPFQVKDREPIVMHIRNAKPLVLRPKTDDQTKAITMQFPVSSGQQHRLTETWVPVEQKNQPNSVPSTSAAKQAPVLLKGATKNVFERSMPTEKTQTPAFRPHAGTTPDLATPSTVTLGSLPPANVAAPPADAPLAPAPVAVQPVPPPFVPDVPVPSAAPIHDGGSVFPNAPVMDISTIITNRLKAMRRLQENPKDAEAMKIMNNSQSEMSSWATSKHLPGQFTGSTGVNVLKVHELNSGPQVWARRDQLRTTRPVTGGVGMHLLQKMGWKPGEGLGRGKTGSLQPLMLDVKLDKRGLVSKEDHPKNCPPRRQPLQQKQRNQSQKQPKQQNKQQKMYQNNQQQKIQQMQQNIKQQQMQANNQYHNSQYHNNPQQQHQPNNQYHNNQQQNMQQQQLNNQFHNNQQQNMQQQQQQQNMQQQQQQQQNNQFHNNPQQYHNHPQHQNHNQNHNCHQNNSGKAQPMPSVENKHPVCLLNELASKRKWQPPLYTLVNEDGPSHNKMFLFSVAMDGQTFTPDRGSNTKREAKMLAARHYLQQMGFLPTSQ